MQLNKRESALYTMIMCFCMVLWMAIYNVARSHGELSWDVVAQAWLGFLPAYLVAMAADVFVAAPLAKAVAFRFFVSPESSSRQMVLAISSCMVVPMVLIMSLYGCLEAAFHVPGDLSAILPTLPLMWLQTVGFNFIMALPWNLLVAGPVSRKLFRTAFPEGTVHEQPVKTAASAIEQ